MKDEDDGEAEDTTTVVLKVLTKSFEELLKILKKQAYIRKKTLDKKLQSKVLSRSCYRDPSNFPLNEMLTFNNYYLQPVSAACTVDVCIPRGYTM